MSIHPIQLRKPPELDPTGDQPAIWTLLLAAAGEGRDLAGYLFYELAMYGEHDRLQVAYLWGGDALQERLAALMDVHAPLVEAV